MSSPSNENIPTVAQRAIKTFTISATNLIVDELVQIKGLYKQKLESMPNATNEQQENCLMGILKQYFGRSPLQQLGLNKKTVINIVNCMGKSLTNRVPLR